MKLKLASIKFLEYYIKVSLVAFMKNKMTKAKLLKTDFTPLVFSEFVQNWDDVFVKAKSTIVVRVILPNFMMLSFATVQPFLESCKPSA